MLHRPLLRNGHFKLRVTLSPPRSPLSVALFARTRPELATPDVKLSIATFSADRPQDGLHKWSGFTLLVYQLRPDSRGEIALKSANPADSPAMRPNFPDLTKVRDSHRRATLRA